MDRHDQRVDLMAAAAADPAALERVYEANVDALYAFVFPRLGRDAALAEDVVHETLLWALDHAGRFDPVRGDLGGWLCTASRNVIRRTLKAHGRTEHRTRLQQTLIALRARPLCDELMARRETQDLVQMALSGLSGDHRAILQHKYVHDSPLRQIAHELDLTEPAAKSLLARARRAFRTAFTALESS